MQTDRWHFPVWLWYALLCIFWWGLWGFLSKIGSAAASPLQMQILFTLGMLPGSRRNRKLRRMDVVELQ